MTATENDEAWEWVEDFITLMELAVRLEPEAVRFALASAFRRNATAYDISVPTRLDGTPGWAAWTFDTSQERIYL